MAVNPDIYGTLNDWVTYVHGDGNVSAKRVYRLNNYIGGNSTTPIGEPIDKSLACSGLGTESCFSHLKFYEVSMLASNGQTASSEGQPILVQPTITEDRTVTNWCFSDTRQEYSQSDYNQPFSLVFDTNYDRDPGGTAANPANSKWAPLPANNSSSNASNITPITQFNHTTLLGVIRVAVKAEKTPNSTNMHWYYLYDYIQNHANDEPYIYEVSIQLYFVQNGNILTGLGSINNTNITILDNIQLPVTNPYMYTLVCYYGSEIKIMGSICKPFNFNTRGVKTDTITSYIGACIPDTWEVAVTWGRTSDFRSEGYICRTYDETFHDEVFSQVACLGILFTDRNPNDIYNFSLIHDDIYCGVLDENLIGHGEWTKGIKNATNDQLSWTNSNDSTYDPSYIPPSGGDDPYDAATDYITAGNGINVGGRWYCDDNLNIWLALINWCNGIDLETYTIQENFYGQNPIDCILEGKIIFIGDYTFGKTIQGSERQPMVIGSYSQDGIGAWAFTHAYPETFDCGDVTINKIYGDFRDLEPYTTYTALLPFASSVELPSDIVVGHTVSLTETIDPQSGDLKYRLLVDGCEYATATGNCAIDLSINGLEIATYRQNKFSLQTQQQTAAINSISSLIGGASGGLIAANYGNIAGAASQIFGGIVNMTNSLNQSSAYNKMAERLKPSPAKIQNATPNVEWGRTPFPCIVASSPRMLAGFSSLEEYKKRVGFATYTVGKIGDQKYTVVCEDVVLSGFSCTKEEMTMIKQLLESGIYIK